MTQEAIDISPFRDLYPFQSHFLDIDGLAYHYLDEGLGEPLIMIHGNPTWSFYFRQLISAFSDRYRVIVPDHIGCGLSAKPDEHRYAFNLKQRVCDLERLIAHLDLDRPATFIVHDWGGMIGLAYMLTHLETIGRVVIMNTAGFFPPGGRVIPWRLRLIRHTGALSRWLVLHLNLFARAAIYMAPRRRLSPKVKKGLLAPYAAPRHRLATLKFVQDIPLVPADESYEQVLAVQRHLHRLQTIPMLILWGRHDFVFTLDYYREWCRRFPGAQHHLFDNAGHYLIEDVPGAIIEHIDAFLQQHRL